MTSSNEAGDNQINVGPQLADTNYKNYVLEVILYLTGGAYVEFQSGLVLDSCCPVILLVYFCFFTCLI